MHCVVFGGVLSYMTSLSAILLVGSLLDSNGFAPILKMPLHKDVRCGSPPLSVWQISLFASGRRMDDKREREEWRRMKGEVLSFTIEKEGGKDDETYTSWMWSSTRGINV